MVWFMWIFMMGVLAVIARLIHIQVKPRNASERFLKGVVQGIVILFLCILFASMYRYYDSMPTPRIITDQTPIEDRLRISRAGNASDTQLDKLSTDKSREVRLALASNTAIPEDYAEILLHDPEAVVRKRIVRNGSVPVDLIEDALKTETDESVKRVIEATLKYRADQAGDTTGRLATDIDPMRRITDALDLLEPESDDYKKIRRAIAAKPFLYSTDSMASDENPDVRYAVASNVKTSSQVLKTLMNDPDQEIRVMAAITLARKPNTDAQFLEMYSLHSNSFVRRAIAANPNTPVHILEQLGKDKITDVAAAIAENRNTPPHTLLPLASSRENEVRRRVARHPNSDENILRILSSDSDVEVRRRVAANENALNLTLDRLSEDGSEDVRMSVALNPSSNVSQLSTLMDDESGKVRLAVASNPNTSLEMLKALAQDADPAVRAQADRSMRSFDQTLKNLNQDSSVFVRRQIAQNADTPAKVLLDLARDPDPYVRERVAFNPATPPEALLLLLKDNEEQVRWAAQENPNRPFEK